MKLSRAHIPAIIWTILMASTCLIPSSSFKKFTFDSFIGLDKIVHLVLYTVFILTWSMTSLKYYSQRKNKLWLLAIGIAYGILIEVLQSVMSLGRSYEWGDIIANTLGSIIGILLIQFVHKNLPFVKKYLPFVARMY